ncbi:COMM domain-containing protein 7-like [Prorops nasuta]|uniref:COMM domain-containing protein 7-like n=1 Tax=Prorops nasuta TaxID=863751 RepID=UPI0034CEBDB5
MDKTISKITDVSWRFGITAASNESDNVGKSFLQLKINYNKNDKIETTFLEMTIGEFYKFIHQLEHAKNNLDILV